MPGTPPVQRLGLRPQVAKAMRVAILTGELTPDDRHFSGSDLAEHFDVSRLTVREALKRLAGSL